MSRAWVPRADGRQRTPSFMPGPSTTNVTARPLPAPNARLKNSTPDPGRRGRLAEGNPSVSVDHPASLTPWKATVLIRPPLSRRPMMTQLLFASGMSHTVSAASSLLCSATDQQSKDHVVAQKGTRSRSRTRSNGIVSSKSAQQPRCSVGKQSAFCDTPGTHLAWQITAGQRKG